MKRMPRRAALLQSYRGMWMVVVWVTIAAQVGAQAQNTEQRKEMPTATGQNASLEKRVQTLEAEIEELKATIRELEAQSRPGTQPAAATRNGPTNSVAVARAATTSASTPGPQANAGTAVLTSAESKTLDFLHDTTVNLGLDSYYGYNFNHPVARVNLLRAYDVLSNEFSLNQASVIFDHPPDLSGGRRWGGRLDLQFGQATDTLQGNPSNEPRPDIYRNVFQVYGTYVVPIGHGLTIDVGKWGSSIGIEGNYTKDQMNYSRAYWFDFLPFYHMGVRAAYKVNDKLALNYWLVNGTNQAEATNGYKDELFGFTATPNKKIAWNMNYYLGQEHPDRVEVSSSEPIPVQPGLTFQAITPAPNGKLH